MSEQTTKLLDYLKPQHDSYRDAFIADLADLVNRDCGTDDKLGVDRVARWCERRCAEWGYAVQTLSQPHFGDNVVGRITGSGKARIMLIGST